VSNMCSIVGHETVTDKSAKARIPYPQGETANADPCETTSCVGRPTVVRSHSPRPATDRGRESGLRPRSPPSWGSTWRHGAMSGGHARTSPDHSSTCVTHIRRQYLPHIRRRRPRAAAAKRCPLGTHQQHPITAAHAPQHPPRSTFRPLAEGGDRQPSAYADHSSWCYRLWRDHLPRTRRSCLGVVRRCRRGCRCPRLRGGCCLLRLRWLGL
jgi:hypothetical protein